MKQLFILLGLNLASLLVRPQERYQLPEVNGYPFSYYLQMQEITPPLDSTGKGIKGYCWVKFKPSVSGKPESLVFSPKTHPQLQREITRLFHFANVQWPNTGFESNSNTEKWLVLPIYYSFITKIGVNEVNPSLYELNEFFNSSTSPKEQQYIFIQTAILSTNPHPHPNQKFDEFYKKTTTKMSN